MAIKYLISTFTFVLFFVHYNSPDSPPKEKPIEQELDLSVLIQPLSDDNIFRDDDYFNWGSSIIKGKDEKYHLFYARWPRANKFTAWLTHSEIAHAVADQPEGPYTYKETVLQSRGGKHWDAITAHNPKIKYFDGQYYLYYISTNVLPDTLTSAQLLETGATGYQHANWSPLRSNQRTGVATSSSLNGPWKRLDAPIVEPSGPITTLTVNPAIAQGADDQYYLIVKGDKPNEERFIRNQAIAISSSPSGPFTISPHPVIDDLDTEDVSMWYSSERSSFYAVFHAHTFIGMMTSPGGKSWNKATHYKVMEKKVLLSDGSHLLPDRMERPFVYVENDVPIVLTLAVKKGNDTYSIFIPLSHSD